MRHDRATAKAVPRAVEPAREPHRRERAARLLAGAAGGAALGWAAAAAQLDVLPPFTWVTWVPLTLLIGALAGLTRFQRWPWVGAAVLGLTWLLVSHTTALEPAVQSLVRADPPRAVDAVAVLSADIRPDGTPDRTTQARLDHAYNLVREGYARRLVVMRIRSRRQSYVPAVRRQVAGLGVPCEVLETVPIGNTRDEIHGIRRLQRERGWTRVIVVSDAIHMRRVRALCRKAGLPALLSPSNHKDFDHRRLETPHQRLTALRGWLHEVYHYESNRLRGWL